MKSQQVTTAVQGEVLMDTIPTTDGFYQANNQIYSKMTLNEFDPTRVTKFRIKEDIFFDKQRSRLESRIIGVAPLMNITTSAELAESVGSTPAFWLYFPQLRYSLVKVDITDPDKGLYDMTMDDLFVQKKYASTIIRESSAGALKLGDEAQQAQDAQQIEQKIDAYKKQLWTSPKGVNSMIHSLINKSIFFGLSPVFLPLIGFGGIFNTRMKLMSTR
ncbi:hypothetical protein OKW96_05465 [Sphingobacterium sp. KU25419]|nr:hypothetical protein OKW96_05465 [Sphingobacterium sp. KU25419]